MSTFPYSKTGVRGPRFWSLMRRRAVLAVCGVFLQAQAQTIGVDYTKLSAQQQTLFQNSFGCSAANCLDKWAILTSSEQLEFAGGTQALATVKLRQTLSGLDQVEKVTRIHGAEPTQPSAKQFNVETGWGSDAPDQFENADGWSEHIALLHEGQYGYQENREWNPFLGLVVLFNKEGESRNKPQFHIDFRSWFAHYCPDNGNIAANYKKYRKWYGPIGGYSPVFMLEFPELARENLPSQLPSRKHDDEVANCFPDIEEAVGKFLTAWYRDRDFKRLLGFVARDNVYNAANLENLGLKSPSELWIRLFSDAFESSSASVPKLEDALSYREPVFRNPAVKLRYANDASVKSRTAMYAIIEPDSIPIGTVLPRTRGTNQEREAMDLQAMFLDHLHQAYRGKLYIVIYVITSPGLVHETAVEYWIREENCWRISAFQGTDW